MKRQVCGGTLIALISATAGFHAERPRGTPASACERLAAVVLPATTIESAAPVQAGPFRAPGPPARAPELMLPKFCRVVGIVEPAIRFEVWLPIEHWNGKFEGVGNGGTAGGISYAAMAGPLTRGYATANTDTGHVNTQMFDVSWARGRPDLLVDFGYRSLHVTTVNAKALIKAFYGRSADHAYYAGCSKGGQQGLAEAQRYPDDYEGIVAGDPASDWTRYYAGGHLWNAIATLADPESYIPAAKVPLLADAVNAACDTLDGVKDGVLNDPRQCTFDPATLTCRGHQDAATCFTPKQVDAIRNIWRGARDASGRTIFPGLLPGGEAGPAGWALWTTGTAPMTSFHWLAASGFFRDAVFQNPGWDFRTFDYDGDMKAALRKVGAALDASDPDLRRFDRRGGKLIVYHGFSDPAISPLSSIEYFDRVVSTMHGSKSRDEALRETQTFFRLFMVPGMQHCAGGPGANHFDMVGALERWVEDGSPPERILASHATNGTIDRSRPLCAYPRAARYTGSGSVDDAASFVCRSQ